MSAIGLDPDAGDASDGIPAAMYFDGECLSSSDVPESVPDLTGSPSWNWRIMIADCDIRHRDRDLDLNGSDDFTDCIWPYLNESEPYFAYSDYQSFDR